MTDQRLVKICKLIHEWCQNTDVQYDIVADEADLQGIMLFKNNPYNLIRYLRPIIQKDDIHVEHQKVRGGTIITFSLEAITESQLNAIIAEAGEEPEIMTFEDRVDSAFTEPPPPIEENDMSSIRVAMAKLNSSGMHIESRQQAEFKAGDLWFNISQARADFRNRQEFTHAVGEAWESMQNRFLEDAERFVGEAQYKTGSTGTERTRNQDNSLGNKSINKRAVSTGTQDENPRKTQTVKGAAHGANRGVAKGTELRYEDKISVTLSIPAEDRRPSDFNLLLRETLGGLATDTGAQPNDLFKQFSRALRVLGQQMGLGPLQDRLKQQGIAWKRSDDGQAIILTIKNATTGADQPIARISHETLSQPNEFETQLKSMLDFATGDAPGAFAQKEIEVQDRKKAIGDIAKAVQPQDSESEVARAMNTGMGGQETMAAQTAAMPKPAAQPAAQPQQRQRPVGM